MIVARVRFLRLGLGFGWTALFLIAAATAQSPNSPPSDSLDARFSAVKWRCIGPFRGGRSVCVSGVPGRPQTYLMGTTGGGLWKTVDAGHHWENVSDGFFQTGSVGAIAVAASDPTVIYVGMGEHAPRGVMTSHGDGVYKSTDGGRTWRSLGLANTQHIARIVIHPHNPDLVYVAAQGALYGPHNERGIYRSQDGGATWKQVHFINDRTGCAELALDPENPRVLYATMWEHQRLPWKIISGGAGSGVYKTTDGGDNWHSIEKGLPDKQGKMAIAVAHSNPQTVYALIESDSDRNRGGLFVSRDGGDSWTRVSQDRRLIQRAWYYTEVFVDPRDEHTVYVLSAAALRSIDGGKTWEKLSGTHGDFHDLWINPDDSRNLIIANDGGAAISFDNGKQWSGQNNQPTGQFYRLSIDNRFPYRIYGGQQDNTSVAIASMEPGNDGITERSWAASAGGESAFLAFDPDHPQAVLGGSYLGTIDDLDTHARAATKIMAAPIQYLGRAARDMKYLFNWNAPIIWSRHEPNTFYHAAQHLLRSRDRGQTWEEASPDLTRAQDHKQGKGGGPYTVEAVGAENYGTISYVVESPHEPGVLWTGSDDGLVYLTRDNGQTWTNVTPKDLDECLVNSIEVSPHQPGTVYLATTRYKFNDKRPGLLKTTDYGTTWTSIDSGIPEGAFTRVVREDERRKGLLLAGTETGLFISRNGGKQWEPFQLNLPVTPIHDLAIRHGDVIVATAGRGFWILDDWGLFRQFTGADDEIRLLQPDPAVISNHSSELDENKPEFQGANPVQGVNPANGLVIYYYLPAELPAGTDVELQISAADGTLVNRFSSRAPPSNKYEGSPPETPTLSREKGLQRFVWDMRFPTLPGIPTAYIEASYRGHKAIPGKYSLKLKVGEVEREVAAQILPNPLYPTTPEQYREYNQAMSEMEHTLTRMHETVVRLYKIQTQLRSLLGRLPTEESYQQLRTEGQALADQLRAWDEDMVQRKSKAYDDVENFPNKFTAEYLFLLNQTESDLPRVTQASVERRQELDMQWQELEARAAALLGQEIPALNQKLWEHQIGGIWMVE